MGIRVDGVKWQACTVNVQTARGKEGTINDGAVGDVGSEVFHPRPSAKWFRMKGLLDEIFGRVLKRFEGVEEARNTIDVFTSRREQPPIL